MKFLNFKEIEFDYLRVTPMINNRNFNNKDLASSIFKLLSTLKMVEVIRNDDDKFEALEVNNVSTIAYIIDMSKKDTNFIFRVPVRISKEFQSKLQENFKDSLITKVDYVELTLKFAKYMVYKNNDPLSIHVDSKQQEFINTLVENIEELNENERIQIQMTFTPVKRLQRVTFKDYTKDVEMKIKNRQSLAINRGIGKAFTSALISTGVGAVNGLLGSEDSHKTSNNIVDMAFSLVNQEEFKTSAATKNKKISDLLNATIRISSDNRKALNSTINSFSTLDSDDNSLVDCNSLYSNVMSIAEVGQLLQVIGNVELMNKYNISYLKHKEIKLPSEILKGTLRIGTSSYRNTDANIYLSDDGDNKNLATVITGPTRSGKTTFIKNIIRDAINTGSSAIFFDFIKTCEASKELLEVIPKEKCTIINLEEKVEGLDFNEIQINVDCSDITEQWRLLKAKANAIIELVDSCNLTNDEELKSQMRKILMSAVLVAFSQNRQLRDAIDCLQDHKVRMDLIKNTPKNLEEKLKDSIVHLKELNEKDTQRKVSGTKMSKINSIMNRLYALQMNVALEEMLETDSSNNYNLIDEMQKGKFIVIQIPDSIAASKSEKDIICSYYFNRLWFALQKRASLMKEKDQRRLILVVDEIYQLPTTEALFKDRINQIAKYQAKFVVSCHGIDQINNLKKELINADASYILIAGSHESNINHLKQMFRGVTGDDLSRLVKYSALCSIKTTSNEYVQCVVDLPSELKKTKKI